MTAEEIQLKEIRKYLRQISSKGRSLSYTYGQLEFNLIAGGKDIHKRLEIKWVEKEEKGE